MTISLAGLPLSCHWEWPTTKPDSLRRKSKSNRRCSTDYRVPSKFDSEQSVNIVDGNLLHKNNDLQQQDHLLLRMNECTKLRTLSILGNFPNFYIKKTHTHKVIIILTVCISIFTRTCIKITLAEELSTKSCSVRKRRQQCGNYIIQHSTVAEKCVSTSWEGNTAAAGQVIQNCLGGKAGLWLTASVLSITAACPMHATLNTTHNAGRFTPIDM